MVNLLLFLNGRNNRRKNFWKKGRNWLILNPTLPTGQALLVLKGQVVGLVEVEVEAEEVLVGVGVGTRQIPALMRLLTLINPLK